MTQFIIFDTETTGLLKPSCVPIEEQPHIIELGAIKVENGEIIDKFSCLVKPPIAIPDIITKITGITDEDVKDSLLIFTELLGLSSFFKDADALVCHNASFDVGMVELELKRIGQTVFCFNFPDEIICTVQHYEKAFSKRPSLKRLYKQIIGENLKQTHRAIDDCMALHEILLKDRFYDDFKGET